MFNAGNPDILRTLLPLLLLANIQQYTISISISNYYCHTHESLREMIILERCVNLWDFIHPTYSYDL